MMARPPVGTVDAVHSRSALYAFVAFRLGGILTKDRGRFISEDLEIAFSAGVPAKAAGPYLWKADGDERGRPGKPRSKGTVALRPWLLVDEPVLGFERALVRVQGDRTAGDATQTLLSEIVGVREVLVIGPERDIAAVVLTDGPLHKAAIRKQLDAARLVYTWEEIWSHDPSPALSTWAAFASLAAQQEGLRRPNASTSIDRL